MVADDLEFFRIFLCSFGFCVFLSKGTLDLVVDRFADKERGLAFMVVALAFLLGVEL